jgi:glycosyltransferase involved in cell wall biosynthesis
MAESHKLKDIKMYFFIQHYPAWKTGGHKYHSKLYEYALGKGYPVSVFGNSRIEDKYFKNKIIRIFYGIWNTLRIPRKSIIVMTNASFLDYIIPVYLIKFFKSHKYFFIIHHLVQNEKPGSKSRRILEDAFMKKADYFVTVSETTKAQLARYGFINKNIKVVNPGVDSKPNENFTKVFPEKFTMLYVGTIEKRKGLMDLVKAIEFINDKNFKINVVGLVKEEDYYSVINEYLKQINSEHLVEFHGRLSDEKLDELYRNSSLFVFPSYWEGYGMVVTEALSRGLPVAVSNIPAFQEIITDGREGVFFETNNPENIAENIDALMVNNELLKSMSENALVRAMSFDTYDEMSCKIMNEIEEFVTQEFNDK